MVQHIFVLVYLVFGDGMVLGSGKTDIGLCTKTAKETNTDIWLPYYLLCHEHDMLENVQMIFKCYKLMLESYEPQNIIFLGVSSGGALVLDLITYINELNDIGDKLPIPRLLISVSPASLPVTGVEKDKPHRLAETDIVIPKEFFHVLYEIMQHGSDIPEKHLATAHVDFRNAPTTHFYYGSAEALYVFAPSYAQSFHKIGADCVIHVEKGMHHCHPLQYFIPSCKSAFEKIIKLIKNC